MATPDVTKNAMADEWASRGAVFSLHTGDPGTSGVNEVTDGSYSRQTTTWGTAAGGTVAGSKLTFDVSASTTVTHVCRWSGATLVGVYDPTDATVTPSGKFETTPSYTYTGP
ncbi:hypothetical protein [Rhodococcus sp. Chr-9]|uniref:phage tail fiber protein n=1 Tax=Rhodococcus sp. Chr-9 TaxID=713612 RepID=UPI000574C39C|nr:hypothetical protein [Rhodococcus sp. Chr-9]KHJ74644.1 hypothetical protein QR64_00160 [Rhodococcus sp. Chr-9]